MRTGLFSVALVALCTLAPAGGGAQENTFIEMKVKRVVLDPSTKSPVVILESTQDKKVIKIWVGDHEGMSIAMELEKVTTPRPLPYDLIRNILQGVGATLYRITVTDIQDHTYLANLTLRLKGQEFQIDSRPSDAIVLAMKMKAPIYATTKVLSKAGDLPASSAQGGKLRQTLGIHLQDLTPELASLLDLRAKRGILVADVELGSAASEAGVQRGDVILRVNDRAMQKAADLESLVQGAKRPGQLRMEVLRKGKTTTVVVNLPS